MITTTGIGPFPFDTDRHRKGQEWLQFRGNLEPLFSSGCSNLIAGMLINPQVANRRNVYAYHINYVPSRLAIEARFCNNRLLFSDVIRSDTTD